MESSHVLVHVVSGPYAGEHWFARSRMSTVSPPDPDSPPAALALVQYHGLFQDHILYVAETPEEVVGAPTRAIQRVVLDLDEVIAALAMTDIGGRLVNLLLDAREVLQRNYPGVVPERLDLKGRTPNDR